jgi:4-amino-4-deoxy-L-arabinose transferase-like glycosyltransferase
MNSQDKSQTTASPELANDDRAHEPARGTRAAGFGPVAAWVLTITGLLLPFLVMSNDRRWAFSVIVGGLGCSAAAVGLMRLLGGWNADAEAERRVTGATHSKPLLILVASAVAFVLATWFAVRGMYPAHRITAAVLVTGTFLGLVVAAFNLGRAIGFWRNDENGAKRPLLQRQGFWLIALSTLLYLPTLGNFGLIDPWETHYGEVAREMLARDDWVSLWWAHDGWFWSKPILNFWLQGLSFKLFGVQYMPDQMLSGLDRGYWPQPEWACRLPIFFMTLVGAYVLYRSAVRPWGRPAAFLGGVILATCPYWFILARQTMADMPYVAPLCAGMGFLLLGFQTDPDARLRDYTLRLGKWQCTVNGFHLLFGVILLCLLPQALYLFSRNLTFHTTDLLGFRPHLDEFMSGSGGENCGQPGNKSCRQTAPLYAWGQPSMWSALWVVIGLGYLFLKRNERRRQRLFFIATWFCTAIAVMGKGAPGLVLPLATALVFIVVSGRWKDLGRLELGALVVLVLAVALPWYVQMYMRHGQPFFERLILHDMVKRAFEHVHDTNKGDDVSFRYYVWQLGYGLFPWSGFCGAGLLWWAVGRRAGQTPKERAQREATTFLVVWWVLVFGMFSVTLTKFHHYILPLVPPTAVLSGVLLARYAPTLPGPPVQKLLYATSLLLGLSLLGLGCIATLPGQLDAGLLASGEPAPGRPFVGGMLALAGLLLLAVGIWRFGRDRDTEMRAPSPQDAALGILAILAAFGVALAGRDQFVTRKGDVEGPSRIIHLFTYNYSRDFPESLDFAPALIVFTVMATACTLLLAIPRLRRHAAVMVCCVGGLYTVWCTGIYLMQIAPHWGQRETIVAYYKNRTSDEKLVAYQMNWKGENFYTGNRMATFVASGAKFKKWIKKRRRDGEHTMFFTTEHSRLSSLQKELGKPENFELLTDETFNNKFFLAKVVFDELPTEEKTKSRKRPKSARSKMAEPPTAASPSNAATELDLDEDQLDEDQLDEDQSDEDQLDEDLGSAVPVENNQ